MSYILDALKKAERERGIAQVPTLATMHDLRSAPKIRLWVVLGLCTLCIASALWFFIPSSHKNTRVAQSGTSGPDPMPNRQTTQPTEEPAPATAPSFSRQPVEPPASQKPLPPREITMGEARGTAGSATASQAGIVISAPGSVTPKPAAGERARMPASRALAPPLPNDDDVGMEEEVPESAAVLPKPASLRDAMRRMTMSIHMYSENKAERLVFINGRKYVEGDLVDDEYLLESITPEGVVLSYKEERATLRPGNR